MHNGLIKLTLPNGLLVLLKEIHTAPIVSNWIWYRVGSRDERPGNTGVSHWIEHMLFKGTPQFSVNILEKTISRDGGFWNAMTYIDWTTCFETMPTDKIDLALQLEADRMVNCLFDATDVEAERTVIISERQGYENEPTFRLGEEIQAVAFRIHPYHHEVVGDLADLQSMQRDDLYQHYRRYYTPNNAVLSIAGDFNSQQILERVRELYEPIKPGPQPPRLSRPEPPQNGERRVTLEGHGDTTYLQIAYHIPDSNHPDFLAVTVLDSLLTGPSNLNIFGGGITNKTSRLYLALVERELAVSVQGGVHATIDPYLEAITCVVHPQHTVEEVLTTIDAEIHRLQNDPPPLLEVARAVKQARALFAYGSESITNQAFWLGFSEMFADINWFLNCLQNLSLVTPQDVQRAARTYLIPQNRIIGVYIPKGNGEEK